MRRRDWCERWMWRAYGTGGVEGNLSGHQRHDSGWKLSQRTGFHIKGIAEVETQAAVVRGIVVLGFTAGRLEKFK